eukprot:GHVQ01015044.1.p1 GENE.GHVQ01015044.1~~GHVQ01015044.1.p1  ORF type:complete len:247 (+),score=8.78 GHVQ01015044.1:403-1143(+)
MQSYGSAQVYDEEALTDMSEKEYGLRREARNGFIRKVYGLVCALLSVAAAFCFCCVYIPSLQQWIVKDGLWLVITCTVLFVIIGLFLSCYQPLASSYPYNYICLFSFAACLSVMLGAVTASTSPYIVAQAVLGTAVVVGGLTLFAFQSRYDFTSWYGALTCCLLAFLVFGLLTLFFRKNRWLDIVYCTLGILLFSAYIIMDTALIIGRGKMSFTEDDYIIAAMILFVDIINMFMHILRLLQRINEG